MSDRTPKPATVRAAWCRAHPFWATTDIEEREAEFDRMIAEVERKAAEKAWAEGYRLTTMTLNDEIIGILNPYSAEAYRREGKE